MVRTMIAESSGSVCLLTGAKDAPRAAAFLEATATPRDSVQVNSPFLRAIPTSSTDVRPSLLSNVAVEADEAPAHLTTVQNFTAAGLGGLALVGVLMSGGTAHAAVPPPQEPTSVAQTVRRTTRPAANLGAVAQQDTTHRDGSAPTNGRVRIFGQDVATPQDVPGVKWSQYKGTYQGQGFSIDYPEGWSVTKLFNGVAIFNPRDARTAVLFQWRSGQGAMTPQGLTNMLLTEAGANNIHVNSAHPSGPKQTPYGPLYVVESDLSYSADGNQLRGEITAAVSSVNAYIPFWSGNLVAAQTPAQDFNKNAPILRHVAASFTGS